MVVELTGRGSGRLGGLGKNRVTEGASAGGLSINGPWKITKIAAENMKWNTKTLLYSSQEVLSCSITTHFIFHRDLLTAQRGVLIKQESAPIIPSVKTQGHSFLNLGSLSPQLCSTSPFSNIWLRVYANKRKKNIITTHIFHRILPLVHFSLSLLRHL